MASHSDTSRTSIIHNHFETLVTITSTGQVLSSKTMLKGTYSEVASGQKSDTYHENADGPDGVNSTVTVVVEHPKNDPFGTDDKEPLDSLMQQITNSIGQRPLKELVSTAVQEIERRCLEHALVSAGGNKAMAAKLLGLSRQSLYVKLRRAGIEVSVHSPPPK